MREMPFTRPTILAASQMLDRHNQADVVIVAVALRHRLEEAVDERGGPAQRLVLDFAAELDEPGPPSGELLSLAYLGEGRVRGTERELDLALATLSRSRSGTATRNHRFDDLGWADGPGIFNPTLYHPFVPPGAPQSTDSA